MANKQKLWNLADTLRGKMEADKFRDYIRWYIFNNCLSDRVWRDSIKE